jgi:hypothetical protein
LAFYVRHFGEAEAIRELREPPAGIPFPDWIKVQRVVGSAADSEADAVITDILDSDIAQAIHAAGRFPICQYGRNAVRKHWALAQSVGEKENGPEALLLGLAIDGDKQVGPWLGTFLNYRRRPASMLRRAAVVLTSRKIDYVKMVDADRGWTGQLVLGRFPLRPDSTASELSSWIGDICRAVLVDMWKELADPTEGT